MPSIAASASASVEKRTNPNPRLRLVSRSLMTIYPVLVVFLITCKEKELTASSMVPNFSNPARRVSSVVCHARPLIHLINLMVFDEIK